MTLVNAIQMIERFIASCAACDGYGNEVVRSAHREHNAKTNKNAHAEIH